MSRCYRFQSRRPMTYRAMLRTIPEPLRRKWWAQRWRYDEPRVAISRMYRLTWR